MDLAAPLLPARRAAPGGDREGARRDRARLARRSRAGPRSPTSPTTRTRPSTRRRTSPTGARSAGRTTCCTSCPAAGPASSAARPRTTGTSRAESPTRSGSAPSTSRRRARSRRPGQRSAGRARRLRRQRGRPRRAGGPRREPGGRSWRGSTGCAATRTSTRCAASRRRRRSGPAATPPRARPSRAGASELEIHHAFLRGGGRAPRRALPYTTIVALDEKAATLHYESKRTLRDGRVLLLDAGAPAAATPATSRARRRPRPATPRFVGARRAVDDLERELAATATPGRPYLDVHLQAHRGVARDPGRPRRPARPAGGGLRPGATPTRSSPTASATTSGSRCTTWPGRQADRTGTPAPPPQEHPYLRNTRPIEPGHVFTIEPGIYFIPMLLRPFRSGRARGGLRLGADRRAHAARRGAGRGQRARDGVRPAQPHARAACRTDGRLRLRGRRLAQLGDELLRLSTRCRGTAGTSLPCRVDHGRAQVVGEGAGSPRRSRARVPRRARGSRRSVPVASVQCVNGGFVFWNGPPKRRSTAGVSCVVSKLTVTSRVRVAQCRVRHERRLGGREVPHHQRAEVGQRAAREDEGQRARPAPVARRAGSGRPSWSTRATSGSASPGCASRHAARASRSDRACPSSRPRGPRASSASRATTSVAVTSSPGPTRREQGRVLLEHDEVHRHRGHEAGDVLVGDRDRALRDVDGRRPSPRPGGGPGGAGACRLQPAPAAATSRSAASDQGLAATQAPRRPPRPPPPAHARAPGPSTRSWPPRHSRTTNTANGPHCGRHPRRGARTRRCAARSAVRSSRSSTIEASVASAEAGEGLGRAHGSSGPRARSAALPAAPRARCRREQRPSTRCRRRRGG